MRKYFLRAASVLLSVCLIFSAMPAVFAAEQEQSAAPQIKNRLQAEAKNSVGAMLADEVEDKQAELSDETASVVMAAEVSGNTVTVDFNAREDATLVAAVYDEACTTLLATGCTAVEKEQEQATVTVDIGSMPSYFYLKVYLVEPETMRPLSTVFESPKYTQEMQALLNSTVNDYDSDLVLNLDGSDDNNFAVYSENTIQLTGDAGTNVVALADDDSQTYVIENADATVQNLSAGDIFAYEYGENQVLAVKVDSISLSGGTATIHGSDMELSDVFDYMKIDGEAADATAEVDSSTLEDGVTFDGVETPQNTKAGESVGANGGIDVTLPSYKFSVSKKFFGDHLGFTGSVNFTPSVSFTYDITLSYQYVSLSIKTASAISGAISLSGSGTIAELYDNPLGIPLPRLYFAPVPALVFAVKPEIVLEGSASVTFSATITDTAGFSWSNRGGFHNESAEPQVVFDCKVEGTLFVGININPQVIVLGAVLDAGIDAKVGAEIKATNIAASTKDLHHDCKNCLAGVVNAKMTISAWVKPFKLKCAKLEITLVSVTRHLFDFYYSFDFNEFGFGLCPHKNYSATVVVKDAGGKAVNGADLMITDASGSEVRAVLTTNTKGTASAYLHPGTYKVTINSDLGIMNKTLLVRDHSIKEVYQYTESGVYDGVYTVAGGSSEMLGTFWDPENTDNDMELVGNIYRKIYYDVQPDDCYQLKIVKDHSWDQCYGDTKGRSYSFSVTKTCDVTVTFNPNTKIINVTGAYVGAVNWEKFLTNGIIVTGFGDSNWLNGIDWDPSAVENKMTEVAPRLYEITYSGLLECGWPEYQFKFNAFPNWNLNWGESKSFMENDEYHDNTVKNRNLTDDGNIIRFDVPYDNATVKLVLDLRNWTYETGGAKYSIIFSHGTGTNAKTVSAVGASQGESVSKTFDGLTPNATYNFYSMKDYGAAAPFGTDNLLYITQQIADENGSLTVSYTANQACDAPNEFVVQARQTDLSQAEVAASTVLTATGEPQEPNLVVRMDSMVLTEGVDYYLEGDFAATDVGAYTVIINGRGMYTGSQTAAYIITGLGDVNTDGHINIRDVTAIQRQIAAIETPSGEEWADINGDGETTIDDATHLQRFLAEFEAVIGSA